MNIKVAAFTVAQKLNYTIGHRGQKYFNIALVLQDKLLVLQTHTSLLKAYAIKNILGNEFDFRNVHGIMNTK